MKSSKQVRLEHQAAWEKYVSSKPLHSLTCQDPMRPRIGERFSVLQAGVLRHCLAVAVDGTRVIYVVEREEQPS